jgi:hypothetical protein
MTTRNASALPDDVRARYAIDGRPLADRDVETVARAMCGDIVALVGAQRARALIQEISESEHPRASGIGRLKGILQRLRERDALARAMCRDIVGLVGPARARALMQEIAEDDTAPRDGRRSAYGQLRAGIQLLRARLAAGLR